MKLPLIAPASVIAALSCAMSLFAMSSVAKADNLSCVSTTFNLLSPNDKVCVTFFEDPKVQGVTCYIAQARTGGWGQPLGLNEDPSNFSVACRQTSPINIDFAKLADNEEVFTEKTSIFFKATRIYRMPDRKHNTLVYLAVSTKIVNGSPENAISTVSVPWPAASPTAPAAPTASQ